MTTQKVGHFIGSLANGSINRTLSKALLRVPPLHMEFTEIPIGNLPLYSYDYDAEYLPEGRHSWRRSSMGAIGTAVGQQSLKQVLAFCNSPHMNAVEAYIHFKPEDYGEYGEITNPELESFLRTYMQEFHEFIARPHRPAARRALSHPG